MIEKLGFIERISFQRFDHVSVQVNVKLESGIEVGTVLSWGELHETFFHMAAQNPLEFAHLPMSATKKKDAFLWQVLEEMDGWDGVLLAQEFYDFIVGRDGACPYSVSALEAWLNEKEEEEQQEHA